MDLKIGSGIGGEAMNGGAVLGGGLLVIFDHILALFLGRILYRVIDLNIQF